MCSKSNCVTVLLILIKMLHTSAAIKVTNYLATLINKGSTNTKSSVVEPGHLYDSTSKHFITSLTVIVKN